MGLSLDWWRQACTLVLCARLDRSDVALARSLQIQGDKEKLLFELDALQSQMEKVTVSASRLQTEKEDAQMDADRQREKCEKLQVSAIGGESEASVLCVMCAHPWRFSQ